MCEEHFWKVSSFPPSRTEDAASMEQRRQTVDQEEQQPINRLLLQPRRLRQSLDLKPDDSNLLQTNSNSSQQNNNGLEKVSGPAPRLLRIFTTTRRIQNENQPNACKSLCIKHAVPADRRMFRAQP